MAAKSRRAAPTPAPSNKRDIRLDFFRGLALICIFIDHVPNNYLARLTLQNFGFCDAAEVFVLIAGISSALAYAYRPSDCQRILLRVRTIYLAQVALVLATAGIFALASWIGRDQTLLLHPALEPFVSHFGTTLGGVFILSFQPEFMDILPLYILMLLGLVSFLRIAERSLVTALAISSLIWLIANIFGINLPGHRNGSWFFNPFAWQLLLCWGVAIGMCMLRGVSIVPGWASRWALAFAIAFLTFAFLHKRPWAQFPIQAWRDFHVFPPFSLAGTDKTFLSLWRLAHVLCLAYVVGTLVKPDAAWLHHSSLAQALISLGKIPLTTFVAASLTSSVGTIVLHQFGVGLGFQVIVNAGGLGVLLALSRAYTTFRHTTTADCLRWAGLTGLHWRLLVRELRDPKT